MTRLSFAWATIASIYGTSMGALAVWLGWYHGVPMRWDNHTISFCILAVGIAEFINCGIILFRVERS
jgi:hypothetical protein